VLLVPQPPATALPATDPVPTPQNAQVRRLVPYSSNLSAVAQELKMISQTESSVGDMQRKIRALASGPAKGNQIEADKIIETTYNQYRHDPAIRVEYGGVLIRREQIDEAKVIGEQLLRKEPTNLRAMSLVSRVLMKQGKFDEAIKVMENANGLAPGNPDRLISLGDAFFKTGKNDKAKAYLKQAKEADASAGTEADKVLGQVALSEGDMAGALELLVGSCTEDETAGFFNNSAVQASKAGKPEKALELYQTALKAVKTNRLRPAIYYNIALSYSDLDLVDDALKAVNQALKIDKKFEKAIRLKEKLERDRVA
jgi:tetratricopeptide (TPR) repeat protein